ncbi:MAG: D-aminoacylase [Gemmataceae bacterium]|nr:D-aminoacylase [Gemmataceae bacterium]
MITTLLASLLFAADPFKPDFILTNATLVDGTGKAAFVGDLAIAGQKIIAIGKFQTEGQPKRIDAKGKIVAPGFIDLHTHSDYPMQKTPTNANLNYLFQGVTTAVTGNCGSGPVDTAKYYAALEKIQIGSNVAHQAPHNDVRRAAMGNVNRAPTEDEVKKMEALVEKAMKDGAWGLSTGLIYNPGTYSKTAEIISLAKIASRHGGFYASHIRDEGSDVLVAINEALTIGREANLPVHISHLKVSGRNMWGKSGDVLGLLLNARKQGARVTADQYPYSASSTSLTATVVPSRFREGERADMEKRFLDPEIGPLMENAIDQSLKEKKDGADLRIARCQYKPAWAGKTIASIAKETGKTPLQVAVEIEKNGGAQIVHFSMNDEDMRLFMKQEMVATASDGGAMAPDKASVPHPRNYGTFPRKIGLYSIQEKLLPLEQAIRSASGLPADILGLKDRGYLKVGAYADVVVFDPALFRDKATFDKPHQYAAGMEWVFVNGVPAIAEGKPTGKLPGKALRHQ